MNVRVQGIDGSNNRARGNRNMYQDTSSREELVCDERAFLARGRLLQSAEGGRGEGGGARRSHPGHSPRGSLSKFTKLSVSGPRPRPVAGLAWLVGRNMPMLGGDSRGPGGRSDSSPENLHNGNAPSIYYGCYDDGNTHTHTDTAQRDTHRHNTDTGAPKTRYQEIRNRRSESSKSVKQSELQLADIDGDGGETDHDKRGERRRMRGDFLRVGVIIKKCGRSPWQPALQETAQSMPTPDALDQCVSSTTARETCLGRCVSEPPPVPPQPPPASPYTHRYNLLPVTAG
ncbi:unnamed protein product [Danaus chrysippus]|uniref:(African queen) hypothetical protein n=1 Tax=Danaus chrysippus TaxID=151541 RepID=A0A8J2QMG0_9NEOP|nr:unnamed protein product [Danaus chrysippus]